MEKLMRECYIKFQNRISLNIYLNGEETWALSKTWPKWGSEELKELNIVEIVLANFNQKNVFLITCIKIKAGASTVMHAQTPINVAAGKIRP